MKLFKQKPMGAGLMASDFAMGTAEIFDAEQDKRALNAVKPVIPAHSRRHVDTVKVAGESCLTLNGMLAYYPQTEVTLKRREKMEIDCLGFVYSPLKKNGQWAERELPVIEFNGQKLVSLMDAQQKMHHYRLMPVRGEMNRNGDFQCRDGILAHTVSAQEQFANSLTELASAIQMPARLVNAYTRE